MSMFMCSEHQSGSYDFGLLEVFLTTFVFIYRLIFEIVYHEIMNRRSKSGGIITNFALVVKSSKPESQDEYLSYIGF